MSRGPSSAKVAQLLTAARLVREQDQEIASLQELIRDSQRKLESALTARRHNAAAISKLMEEMDCHTYHNNGWEGRIVELLTMLVAQAAPKPAGEPVEGP